MTRVEMKMPSQAANVPRELVYQLAQCINVAYASTSNKINTSTQPALWDNKWYYIPSDEYIAQTKDLIAESAKTLQVSLRHVEPIWVCESIWNPFTPTAVLEPPRKPIGNEKQILRAGFLLFGYYALGTYNGTDVNLCIYRGTATVNELDASITFPTYKHYDGGWDTVSSIQLPTPMWNVTPPELGPKVPPHDTESEAKVKASFWEWYTSNATTVLNYPFLSVAQSASWSYQKYMAAVNNASNPWFFAGHSLGGPMVSLTALDMSLAGLLAPSQDVRVVTFGSLVVGNKAFADLLTSRFPAQSIFRVNNACDAIPSLRGFWAGTSTSPKFVHAGVPVTFVWQKDDDYANHSMKETYTAMFEEEEKFKSVVVGHVVYPAALEQ